LAMIHAQSTVTKEREQLLYRLVADESLLLGL
jgi:hypothetical protein